MTELDLRETLERHIGGVEVPPGDPLVAVARGRRRRRLRTGVAAGATATALLAVPIALLTGPDDGRTAVDRPAGSPSPTSPRHDPSPDDVQPGGTRTTPLGDPMVFTKTGSKTVLIPEPPPGATAVSVSVLCLSAGTLYYPDGASTVCGPGDVAAADADPRDDNYYLLMLTNHRAVGFPRTDGRTLAFTTTPGMSWKLSATYVHTEQLPWAVNAHGQTYGVENDHGTPDLVAVIATNGRTGYSYATDLNGAQPTSPAEAQALNDAYPDGRDIPVYESDGRTQIGIFHIGG
jgi:hypothetical protein